MLINIIKAFFAVFGVMDPLGNTPVFISLTDKLDTKSKCGVEKAWPSSA